MLPSFTFFQSIINENSPTAPRLVSRDWGCGEEGGGPITYSITQRRLKEALNRRNEKIRSATCSLKLSHFNKSFRSFGFTAAGDLKRSNP